METLKKNKIYNKKFFIYGHRGVPSLEQENTIPSFQKAIELNYDGIELDVQITKDNKIIIYHDTVEKESKKKIAQCYYKQILNNNKKATPSNPLLLNKVLDQLGHQTIINIEIKNQGKESILLVKKIIKKIKNFNLVDSIIISSFNPYIIKKSKQIDDRIQTAWIWGKDNFYFYNTWNFILHYFKPDAIHMKDILINKNIVNKIHLKNMKILAYTVNDVSLVPKLIKHQIDGIFTDCPAVMKAGKSLAHQQS